MSLLETTKFLLRKHRISPKKSLGQNFMVDSSILQLMADYAALGSMDVVLDIGAGLGFLTQRLVEKCKCVVAIETDEKLVEVLREQLRDVPKIRIIKGNVLKVTLPDFDKVVSIPPYHISSSLLSWLFQQKFKRAVLIFQKEFANRLIASVGTEDYGWLAVVAYYYAEVELLDAVPKWMFYPEPNVDSIIVRLTPRASRPFTLKNQALFKQLAQSLFSRRNRKVRNAVLPFLKRTDTGMLTEEKVIGMIDGLPFRDTRVRELAPEDFGVLANVLTE